MAGSIGFKGTNLELPVDVTVVGRRHVEIFQSIAGISVSYTATILFVPISQIMWAIPFWPDNRPRWVKHGSIEGARQRHDVGPRSVLPLSADEIPASKTSAITNDAKRTSIGSGLLSVGLTFRLQPRGLTIAAAPSAASRC
jgi:hypothetical protein